MSRKVFSGFLPLLILAALTDAFEILHLDEKWENHQKCTGVWGAESFSSQWSSSIIFNISASPSSALVSDGYVSVVMFELGDEHLGGITVRNEDGSLRKETLCDTTNIAAGHCTSDQLGTFLISERAYKTARQPLITRAVNLTRPTSIFYPVREPGYYCVATNSEELPFHGTMAIIDGRGVLPAAQRPALELFNILAPTTVALSLTWSMFKMTEGPKERHRSPRLPMTALVWLSTFSVLAKWFYYYAWNENWENPQIAVLPAATQILRVMQVALVAYSLFSMVKATGDRQHKKHPPRKYLWLVNTITLMVLGTGNIRSPYVTAILGAIFSAGLFYMALSWGRGLHDHDNEQSSMVNRTRLLLGGMFIGGLMSLCIVLINIKALAFDTTTEQLFQSRHWRSRWFWMDGLAYESLPLVAVVWITVCQMMSD